jgi:hypothetical protein
MDEVTARRRIRAALEAAVDGRNGLVDHHMRAIKKVSAGDWSEGIARSYVQNLETQLEEESEAMEMGFRNYEAEDLLVFSDDIDESASHTERYRYSM